MRVWRLALIWALIMLGEHESLLAQSQEIPTSELAIAESLLTSGDPDRAIELLEGLCCAADLDAQFAARALGSMGLARAAMGDRPAAVSDFEESIRLAEQSGDWRIAARSQYNLALTTLSGTGTEVASTNWFAQTRAGGAKRDVFLVEDDNATEELVRAATEQLLAAGLMAEQNGEASFAAKAYATAAKINAQTQPGGALGLLDRARGVVPSSIGQDAIEARLLIGETATLVMPALEEAWLTHAGNIANAELNSALTGSRARNDQRLESYSIGLLGRLYGLQGETEDARQLTERAIFLAEQTNALEILYVWQGQLGSLLEVDGNINAALAAYEQAVGTIQSVRPDLAKNAAGAGQVSSRELIEPILLAYADLLLRHGDAADVRNARNVVEQLKTIEFERFFEETCVAGAEGDEMDVSAVASGTSVLYPVIFEDRLELLLSRTLPGAGSVVREDIQRIVVEVDRATLEGVARSARRSLRNDDGSRGPLDELGQLHDLLIEPIAPLLAEADTTTIVFAPDGLLRGIPLSVLYDVDTKRFLIEDYAVATTLGLSLVDPTPFSQARHTGVFAGISESLQIGDAPPFSSLEAVRAEIEDIRDVLPGPALIDAEFTKDALRNRLQRSRYSVAHLATHATFGRTVGDSYLLAYGGADGQGSRISLDELQDYTAQARIRGEPIELLTLSACETGVGDPNADNELAILGLAGVAFKAGARSVLASLWQVYDDSTGELMPTFYEYLINGDSEASGRPLTKAEALQRAQLQMLKDPEKRHPAHWGAFILFGNWL